jgi:hypothetical protein
MMDRSKERLLELVKLCDIITLDNFIYLSDFKLHPNTYNCYYDINNGILYEAIMEYGSMPHDLIVPSRIEKTVLKEGSIGYNKIFDYVLGECKYFVELIDECKRDKKYHLGVIKDLNKKIKNYNEIIKKIKA